MAITGVQSYTSNVDVNININGLANAATAVSDAFDNSVTGYLTLEVQFSVSTNLATTDSATPTARTPYIYFYLLRSVDGGTTYDDADVNNAELLRVTWTRAANSNTANQYIASVLIDSVPEYFKFMVYNLTSTYISLARPKSICSGPDGNLWIADGYEQRLWKVTTGGTVTWHTNPSDTTFGLGPATFGTLGDICVGSDGNLWVPDFYYYRLWEITTTPTFTDHSPITSKPVAVCYSPSDNNMWYADQFGYVWKVTLSGAATPYLLSLGEILTGICFSNITGDLWVSAASGNVWNVTTGGFATSYFLGGGPLTGICEGSDSNLWASDSSGLAWQITTGGIGTSFTLTGGTPTCIASGSDGNLWLGDPAASGQVWQVTTAGSPTAFSLGGSALPTCICSGPDSNLWLGDTSSGGQVWKVTTAGTPTAYSLLASFPKGICSGPDGNLWVADEGFAFGQVWKVTTGGVGTSYFVITSPLALPIGIASDGADLWVADQRNHAIKIDTTGAVSAAYPLIPFLNPSKVSPGSDGNIWMCEGLTEYVWKIDILGFPHYYIQLPGAGTLWDICDGPDGNLWVCDGNGDVWQITTSGVVTQYTIGGILYGICDGGDGNLWAADGTGNVWKITTGGVGTSYVTTGLFPRGIALGSDGNLWVTTATDKLIEVTTAGSQTVHTLTGANMNDTLNICSGPDGNLWVNDFNGKVWKVTTGGVGTSYTLITTEDTVITLSGKNDVYS